MRRNTLQTNWNEFFNIEGHNWQQSRFSQPITYLRNPYHTSRPRSCFSPVIFDTRPSLLAASSYKKDLMRSIFSPVCHFIFFVWNQKWPVSSLELNRCTMWDIYPASKFEQAQNSTSNFIVLPWLLHIALLSASLSSSSGEDPPSQVRRWTWELLFLLFSILLMCQVVHWLYYLPRALLRLVGETPYRTYSPR